MASRSHRYKVLPWLAPEPLPPISWLAVPVWSCPFCPRAASRSGAGRPGRREKLTHLKKIDPAFHINSCCLPLLCPRVTHTLRCHLLLSLVFSLVHPCPSFSTCHLSSLASRLRCFPNTDCHYESGSSSEVVLLASRCLRQL